MIFLSVKAISGKLHLSLASTPRGRSNVLLHMIPFRFVLSLNRHFEKPFSNGFTEQKLPFNLAALQEKTLSLT